MKIIMNTRTSLVILVLFCLRVDSYCQSAANTYVDRKSQQRLTSSAHLEMENRAKGEGASFDGKEVIQDKPFYPWIVVPSYSHTFFNKGREDWQKETLDIFYQPDKYLLLGGSVDFVQRPPNDDDIMYSFNASWYPLKELEVHGEISHTPDANFLPNNAYSAGFQYILNPKVTLLLDAEQLYFDSNLSSAEYDITQIKPGVSYWFTEKSFVTLRYAHGWVHDELDYDYYSAAVNFGDMPRDGQLTFGFAYGTDPELDFGAPAASLSDAYIATVFYKEPIKPNLSVFAGLEYVYRLRPDNDKELYQSITPTTGLVWKF